MFAIFSGLACVYRPLKVQMDQELAASVNESEIKQIRTAFATREKAIEHEIDHKPMEVHMSLGVKCKLSSRFSCL